MRKIMLLLSILLLPLSGCTSRPTGPDYKEVKGKGDPVLIRWDFSKPVVDNYHFEQTLSQRASSAFGSQGSDKTIIKGTCTVTCEGKSVAVVKVANLKASGETQTKDKNLPPQLRQKYPDVELKGLQEDGSFSEKDPIADIVMRTAFLLPQRPIAPGGTEVIDLAIPFNVNGKPGKLIGKQATTFVDYYEIYGVNCIHLDTKYEYYEFASDDGSTSSGDSVKIKGNSVVYFDDQAKRIHRSDGDCDITLDIGLASVNQGLTTTLHKM